MLKKQIKLVKDRIKEQATIVFGDRRQKKTYREYLDHLYSTNTFGCDRETFMLIVTLSHRALYDVWKVSGKQEVWDLLSDGKPYKE